jgi:hypothetical protein
MKTVTIAFTKNKSRFAIGSYVIRLVDGAPFSHVCIRWDTAYGIPITYEAKGTGINFTGEETFKHHAVIVEQREIELNDAQFGDFMKYCLTHSGIKYGYMQNLGIGIAKLLKLNRNPFRSDENRIVCSELIARILQCACGAKFTKDLDLVTPKDIRDFLDENHKSL